MFSLHVTLTKTWVHLLLMAMRYQHDTAMKGATKAEGLCCHKNIQIGTIPQGPGRSLCSYTPCRRGDLSSEYVGHTHQIPAHFFFPPLHLSFFSISFHPSLTFYHYLALLSCSMRQEYTWTEASEKTVNK